MIQRYFDVQENLLHINYSGTISKEQVLENIHHIFNNFKLPKELRVLEDARKATYELDVEANEEIQKAMSVYVKNFKFIKCAFIQDKAYETAINLSYEYQLPFPNFLYKVFATKENAVAWLNSNVEDELTENGKHKSNYGN